MNMTKNTLNACNALEIPDLYSVVTFALKEKGRLPCQRPEGALSRFLLSCPVDGLYLEEQSGGWVAKVKFKNVPAGDINGVITPVYASPAEAFHDGASLLCYILTGSYELPFILIGD